MKTGSRSVATTSKTAASVAVTLSVCLSVCLSVTLKSHLNNSKMNCPIYVNFLPNIPVDVIYKKV